MKISRWVAWLACLLMIAGCGAQMPSSAPSPHGPSTTAESSINGDSALTNAGLMVQASTTDQRVDALSRRIVYRGDVELVVEQFDPLPEEIDTLVTEYGGFVSASNVTGASGSPRRGEWTVRVPADRFTEILTALHRLGVVHRINSTSADVTAEYYDVAARMRNKQQEEQRLLKLLAEATGKLDEVLTIERELSRVRGEIEQAQGRLRMWNDITELSTLIIRVTEIKNYVAQLPPSYRTRVERAWLGSTTALLATAETVSLVVIVLTPWLPLVLIPVLAAVVYGRRSRPRQLAKSAAGS